MVPLEKLGEKNLLNVYYLSAEIKQELEMTTGTQIKLRAFVRSHTRFYPSYHKERKDTANYMKESGYLNNVMALDDVIYVTAPDQETIQPS